MSRARDIMSKGVTCIRSDDSLVDAARQMARLNLGTLPVCDNDTITGIITDRDIVVRCLARGADPYSVRAGQCVQRAPYTVNADDSTERVLQLMAEHRVRRLVVVEDGDAIGIITEADVVNSCADAEVIAMLRSMFQGPPSEFPPVTTAAAFPGRETFFGFFLDHVGRNARRNRQGEVAASTTADTGQ